MSGRLHGATNRPRRLLFFLLFPLLAMLPDIDVFWVTLGVPDVGLWGHRGITHTPLFALAVGLLAALACQGRVRARLRLGLTVALVVASHGVLDALAQEGRGIFFLWPFSSARYHFPWQPLPDAPTGLAFFSQRGLAHLALELVYFLPVVLYALWPRRAGRVGAPAGPLPAVRLAGASGAGPQLARAMTSTGS